MNKRLFLFLLVFCTVGVILSCERPTDTFNRENPNDPENKQYDPGTATELDISYSQDGIIKISWADKAIYEDGFIIEKSLVGASSFKEIGRVNENMTSFKDSSRTVRQNTFYRISAFREKEDGIKKFESKTQKVESLGEITEFTQLFDTNSKTLNLSWQQNSPFATTYRLEYRKEPDYNFKPIRDFPVNVDHFTDKLSDISFDARTYRLSLLLTGDGYEEVIYSDTTQFNTDIFCPDNLTIEISDEQTINISWNDNTYFETGYKLFRSRSTTTDQLQLIADLRPNSTQFQDRFDLQNGETYTYKLLGYTDHSESDSLEARKRHTISTPRLINDRYTNIQDNIIQLSWVMDGNNLAKKFILERKQSSDESWTEISRFDNNTTKYSVTGVDPNQGYIFRIRTLSSEYSDELQLFYRTLFNKVATFEGHTNRISDLDFSPDGNYLASSSNYALGYGDPFINIWDLNTKQLYKKIDSRDEPITSVNFSSDGTMLASGSWFDQIVKVFEFPSGKLINSFHDVDAYDVKFSPDNKFIAATGGFADVRKWNVETGELLFHYKGHGSPTSTPHSLAYNPNGNDITVDDKGIVVLDAHTGEQIDKLDTFWDYESHPNNIGYSHDGSKLVYTIYSINVYETGSWTKTFTVPRRDSYVDTRHGRLYPTFYPPNSTMVAAATPYKINFRNIETGEILNRLPVSRRMTYFTLSPNGKQVAIGFEDYSIELWNKSDQSGWKELIPYP